MCGCGLDLQAQARAKIMCVGTLENPPTQLPISERIVGLSSTVKKPQREAGDLARCIFEVK